MKTKNKYTLSPGDNFVPEFNDSDCITEPNQAWTIRELLIRSQNGTFPNIDSNTEGDFDHSPEDPDLDHFEYEEPLDISDAYNQSERLTENVTKVMRRGKKKASKNQ